MNSEYDVVQLFKELLKFHEIPVKEALYHFFSPASFENSISLKVNNNKN